MPKFKSNVMYDLFSLLYNNVAHKHYREEPDYSDIGWTLSLIQRGLIRRVNGEAFPADISMEDFAYELFMAADNAKEPFRNTYWKGSLPLMIEHDGTLETFSVDFYFDADGNYLQVDNTELKEIEGLAADDDLEADENILENCRIFDDVRAEVIDILRDLHDTEGLFSPHGTQDYVNLEQSLSALAGNMKENYNPFREMVKFSDMHDMFRDVLNKVSIYENAKLGQEDLSSRQFDRLRVCSRLKNLGKLLTEAKKSEDLLARVDNDDRPEAEKRMAAARKALSRNELLQDKVANNMLFGQLKSMGPKASYRVLKDQNSFEQGHVDLDDGEHGLCEDLFRKLRSADDFRKIIGTERFYGYNTDTLCELSKKSPSDLGKKLRSQMESSLNVAKSLNRGKKWKDTQAEKDSQREILRKLNLIKNPALASICEYTLKLTDQMVKDLDQVESYSHSNSYKLFSNELESLHGKLIERFNNVLSKAADDVLQNRDPKKLSEVVLGHLTSVLQDVNEAAAQYQRQHVGDTYTGAGEKVAKRLEIATGIRVINDFLTDRENQKMICKGDEKSMEQYLKNICAFKAKCTMMEPVHKNDKGELNIANSKFPSFTDYDSSTGFKNEKDEYVEFLNNPNNERSFKRFLNNDPWAKLSGVKKTLAEQKPELGEKNISKKEEKVLGNLS